MANYCQNRLTVSGSEEAIEAFKTECLSECARAGLYGFYVLDFEKIAPKPAAIKGAHRGAYTELGSAGEIGVELLKRERPKDFDRLGEGGLNHPSARSFGIECYEDLERWIRKKHSSALELAKRSIAAHAETGFWFEDEWEWNFWGCDSERVTYHYAALSETAYEAAFCSAWSAPEAILKEVARRCPKLTMRAVCIEEGNDYCFVLNAGNGNIEASHPELTDKLIEEVEGAGEIEDREESERAFYEEPADLRKLPMRHFRHWRDEARLKRALVGYPVYNPPHVGVEMLISEQDARENFDYFMSHKKARVEALRGLLGSFSIGLDYTEGTKLALDGWLAAYAGLLYIYETGCSFLTRNPAWDGARVSLNVIFDLGLFLGDFAIHENPDLKWELERGSPPTHGHFFEQFQRPVVASNAPLLSFPRDPIYEMYQFCNSQCGRTFMWKRAWLQYGSRALARQYFTKTLRHIHLSANGDFQTANKDAELR